MISNKSSQQPKIANLQITPIAKSSDYECDSKFNLSVRQEITNVSGHMIE